MSDFRKALPIEQSPFYSHYSWEWKGDCGHLTSGLCVSYSVGRHESTSMARLPAISHIVAKEAGLG